MYQTILALTPAQGVVGLLALTLVIPAVEVLRSSDRGRHRARRSAWTGPQWLALAVGLLTAQLAAVAAASALG